MKNKKKSRLDDKKHQQTNPKNIITKKVNKGNKIENKK